MTLRLVFSRTELGRKCHWESLVQGAIELDR